MSMTPEANKELVRRWFAQLDRRDLNAVEEFLAEDYVDHNPPIPGLPPGREGVKQANRLLYAAFTEATHTIQDQIAEGDKVMTRVVVRGKFTGEFLGYSPTGQFITLEGAAVHRVAGGKLVEHWAHVDMTSFMLQIGASFPATST